MPVCLRSIVAPLRIGALAAAAVHCSAAAAADSPASREATAVRFESKGAKPIGVRSGESARHGLEQLPAPTLRMPPLDRAFLVAEDESEPLLPGERRPLRVAIAQAVELGVDDGEWLRVEGGWLWRIDLDADAPSSRLHLSGIDLPAGEQLTLSAPEVPDSAVGPLEGRGWFGNGEAWSVFTPASRARIEWWVPGLRQPAELPFARAAFQQAYRDIFAATRQQSGDGGVAGDCHVDPSCHPAFNDMSDGTAKLIFDDGPESLLCTGQVTATVSGDFTPYVSTAVHCIDNEASANSCQFIFRLRADTCFGPLQPGVSITGATLERFHRPSDSTLLRALPMLPAGTFFYGWIAENMPAGLDSVCIHHPGGDPQAISFGTKQAGGFGCNVSLGIPGTPTTNWVRMSWNDGITEQGSSGSAICRLSDGAMYGVLSCGVSACTNPDGDDGYGRWDIAFDAGGFSDPLQGGGDDGLEENDTCATAAFVTSGSLSGLVVKAGDEDHYQILCPPGQSVSVSASFTHAFGDVDLQLRGGCAGGPVAQSLGTGNSESISFTNSTSSSILTLRVFLDSGQRNTYSLVVNAPNINADLDGNGVVNGADLGRLLIAWSTANATVGDLNGDGLVGAADLAILLALWG